MEKGLCVIMKKALLCCSNKSDFIRRVCLSVNVIWADRRIIHASQTDNPSLVWKGHYVILSHKPHVNGRHIVGQQLPTLLDVTCCASVLGVVAQSSLKVWNWLNVKLYAKGHNIRRLHVARLHVAIHYSLRESPRDMYLNCYFTYSYYLLITCNDHIAGY